MQGLSPCGSSRVDNIIKYVLDKLLNDIYCCSVRSYAQFCPVAKALDLVGDRWSLLIVRELLVRGSGRYTDLKEGLPGIATNLLADRLADLEAAGVIRRATTARPTPATLFELTDRGRALEPVIIALAEWGGSQLTRPVKTDAVRAHWLALPARMHLKDHAPWSGPVAVELRTGGETMVIRAEGGHIHVGYDPAERADAVLTGTPQVLVGVLTGGMTLTDAAAWGLQFEGDPGAVRRMQPRAGDWLQQQLFPA
jgi:DNA-binding HxlR family transcriptional regulator/putative sterol carrier protein